MGIIGNFIKKRREAKCRKDKAKFDSILKKAEPLLLNAKYKKAIKLYLRSLRIKVPEKEKVDVKKKLYECYTLIGQDEKAKQFKKELYSYYKETRDALSGYNPEESYITEFAEWKRDSLKIGVFTGTPAQAQLAISNLLKNNTITKFERYLGASKVIKQLLERGSHDLKVLNEHMVTHIDETIYAGQAMAIYGDSLIQDPLGPDNSAIAFVNYQALLLLLPYRDIRNVEIENLYTRYLASFFYSKHDLRDSIKPGENKIFTAIKRNKQPICPMREFLLGLILLLRAVKDTKWEKDLLEELNASLLKDDICEDLTRLGLKTPSDKPSLPKLAEYFNSADEELKKAYVYFEKAVNDCVKNTFKNSVRNEAIEELRERRYQQWLTDSDKKILDEIISTQIKFNDYSSFTEFDKKTNCLAHITDSIEGLIKEIERSPTLLSFEHFLKSLYSQKTIIADEQKRLYAEYPPELTLSLIDHPIKNDDGTVRFRLLLANRSGCRTANNLKISIERKTCASLEGWAELGEYEEPSTVPKGKDVFLIIEESSMQIQGITGGKNEEISLSFRLLPEYIREKVCDITVKISYELRDPVNAKADGTKTFLTEFTLNLYDEAEFKKIYNPYAGLIGQVMKKEDMFYGRSRLIEKLVEQIGSRDFFNKGHAAALYGQTRAGKSSILYHCKKRIKERFADAAIIVDYESLGDTKDLEGFLYRIIFDLTDELQMYHEEIYRELETAGLAGYAAKLTDDRANSQVHFTTFFKRFNAILDKTSGKIVILLIDEFTYLRGFIREGKFTPDFMKIWKAIMQNYGFFAIVVGQDDLPFFKQEFPNEFSSMQLEQVTYLDKEPAMELISKPIRYTNPETGAEENRYMSGAEKLLYDLTAGSPYLILILCDKLVDYLNEVKSIYITASRIEKFIHEKVLCPSGCVTETTFEPQIQDRAKPELNSKNRELLLSIARAEVKGEANLANLKCKIPEVERSELIDRLAERDVITKSKNKYCGIKVRLLSEWLLYAYGRED